MSSYIGEAINPKSGKKERALFLDNWFGKKRDGVAFLTTGRVTVIEQALTDDLIIYPIGEVVLIGEEVRD